MKEQDDKGASSQPVRGRVGREEFRRIHLESMRRSRQERMDAYRRSLPGYGGAPIPKRIVGAEASVGEEAIDPSFRPQLEDVTNARYEAAARLDQRRLGWQLDRLNIDPTAIVHMGELL